MRLQGTSRLGDQRHPPTQESSLLRNIQISFAQPTPFYWRSFRPHELDGIWKRELESNFQFGSRFPPFLVVVTKLKPEPRVEETSILRRLKI